MPASISVDERIVDHRLVVDRQQLLRRHERQRMQPRARAAGQNDALTRHADAFPICALTRARVIASVSSVHGRPRNAEDAREPRCSRAPNWPAGAPGVGNSAVVIAVTRGVAAGERRLRGDDAARETVPGGHARAGEVIGAPDILAARSAAARCAGSRARRSRVEVGQPRWSATTRSSSRVAASRSMVFRKLWPNSPIDPGGAQDHVARRASRAPRARPRPCCAHRRSSGAIGSSSR